MELTIKLSDSSELKGTLDWEAFTNDIAYKEACECYYWDTLGFRGEHKLSDKAKEMYKELKSRK